MVYAPKWSRQALNQIKKDQRESVIEAQRQSWKRTFAHPLTQSYLLSALSSTVYLMCSLTIAHVN